MTGGCLTKVVVNADDFGLTPRVNAGIVRAYEEGVVTSASLMPVGKGFEDAVQHYRACPGLDIGVHLTLVGERPLLREGSSLARDGGHMPRTARSFVSDFVLGRIRKDDVERELRSQIERVIDKGVSVSHLDSHQHLHAFPGITEVVHRLADEYRIPFVRAPVERLRAPAGISIHRFKRSIGATALRFAWTLGAFRRGEKTTSASPEFVGFRCGGHLTQEPLLRLLSHVRLGRVYELMCHPGLRPNEPRYQAWGYEHEGELTALTSSVTKQKIDDRNVYLTNFQRLASDRASDEAHTRSRHAG